MKADTWLIQNIGHSDQARTNLGRQTDSLCFSSGQGSGCPGKRQVFQSHIHQKSKPGTNLLQDQSADLLLHRSQRKRIHELSQLPNRHLSQLGNILISHGNSQSLLLQTPAAAFLTGCRAHELLVLLLTQLRTRLTVPALHILNQSLKYHIIDALSPLSPIAYLNVPRAGAAQNHILNLCRIILKRRMQIKSILLRQRFHHTTGPACLIHHGLPPRYRDCSVRNAQRRIRNQQLLGEFPPESEPIALRTCAERIIKGERTRLQLLNADSAVRAGKALTEGQLLVIYYIYYKQPVCQLQNAFNRIGQSPFNPIPNHQTVNDYLNRMLPVLFQPDILRQLIEIPVHPDTHIPAPLRLFEHLHMFSLASSHHRRKQLDPGSLRQLHQLVHHLIHRLLLNLLAALRAVRNTDSRI